MQSIVAWRERHRLREDEAVLLLVELFRIHQRHWDEIRRRELPSFEQFRADIAKLTEAAKTFQQQITAVLEVLRTHPPAHRAARITRAAAIFAAFASLLAGLLIGIVHDRKLMREAEVNIAIRWFIGYGLHEKLPHHSSLTRIRQRWGEERFRKISVISSLS